MAAANTLMFAVPTMWLRRRLDSSLPLLRRGSYQR